MRTNRPIPLLAATFLLAAAGAAPAVTTARPAPAADREAILAMRGEYTVRFLFDETVVLAPGYARADAQRSGGDEVVVVVEDAPGRIVLQHLLVHQKSGHVTKHWRQDWIYEAPKRWEFVSDQTWRVRDLAPAETQGRWTQCVYEVSDAPRYCGTGRWEHVAGTSTWTSDRGWRPLPRREYTKRDDYNALGVVNRHTIVPGGWTHEQDNAKTVRGADGGIERFVARESGFNDYIRTDALDFKPAYDYWAATSGYWARVRARWDRLLSAPPGVRLKTGLDGMDLIVPLFTQASEVQAGKDVPDAEIDRVFAEWVDTAP